MLAIRDILVLYVIAASMTAVFTAIDRGSMTAIVILTVSSVIAFIVAAVCHFVNKAADAKADMD